ncbi:MAG: DUF4928 family protein [Proteobacteria bacterium]|nr:DUF4928 family protein [Pseudomonadota bacterium]
MINHEARLHQFQKDNNIYTKGPLSLVIQFTRLIRGKSFPLNASDFQTESKGQVAGLGGSSLKKILKEHGILQTLSAEGGRTSRGSMGLMHCCPTKMWRYSWFGTDFLLKGNSAKPPFARSSEPWRSITQFFTH